MLKKKISFLDGYSGYNQISIALEDQVKTTFTCPWGNFAYSVFPFGLCNAPATFQRVVINIFADISHDCMEIYMDDLIAFGVTFEEALMNLEKVLVQCKEHNLSLNSDKCFMLMQEGVVLGHFISTAGIQVDPTKIEVILALPISTKPKDVRSFLGHVGYYRHFIKDFSKIASPLYTLLTKEVEFIWTPECNEAILQLKECFTTTLVLKGPDWSIPFHLHTDASDYVVGVVLGQKHTNIENVIYYISKSLHGPELNYIVTKKELLVVIYALKKFRHYVTGYPIFVHIDNSPIRYLMKKPVVASRLARWLLLL